MKRIKMVLTTVLVIIFAISASGMLTAAAFNEEISDPACDMNQESENNDYGIPGLTKQESAELHAFIETIENSGGQMEINGIVYIVEDHNNKDESDSFLESVPNSNGGKTALVFTKVFGVPYGIELYIKHDDMKNADALMTTVSILCNAIPVGGTIVSIIVAAGWLGISFLLDQGNGIIMSFVFNPFGVPILPCFVRPQ